MPSLCRQCRNEGAKQPIQTTPSLGLTLIEAAFVPSCSHGEQWSAVSNLVTRGDWSALYGGDQLRQEIAAGRVLAGFSDLQPKFKPTFKASGGT